MQAGNDYHRTWEIWHMGTARWYSVRDFLTTVFVDIHTALSGVPYCDRSVQSHCLGYLVMHEVGIA